MSYLLDTNVISELVCKQPNHNVLRWFQEVPDESLYISVLSLGEIRKGVEKIKNKKRQEQLKIWLEHDLPNWFEERTLAIDKGIADRWGRMQSESKRTITAIDSLLAATALYHDLGLVTRNEQDFQFSGLVVINPWK